MTARSARADAIGKLPLRHDLDLTGLDKYGQYIDELLRVDVEGWKAEMPGIVAYMERFGDHLPERISEQLKAMQERLG